MVIVSGDDFSQKQSQRSLYRVFKIMLNSRVVVTSDSIKAMDLFLKMRKFEKSYPNGEFSGLCERIVIQLE